MWIVGITGQIACGKSVVAREFARLGAVVISGDQIGRDVVENDPGVINRLVGAFGSSILSRNGRLNRRALGKIAFSTPQNTALLNRIVHPLLLKKLRREISRLKQAGTASLIVVDAALIFEWGLEKTLDRVVVVESKTTDQIKRLQKQGFSAKEIRDRVRRQMPKRRQRELADFVLRNDGSLADLKRAAGELFLALCGADLG